MATDTTPRFDLERYLKNSKKVDLSGLDFASAAAHPLTANEVRCLTYLMDVESHTVAYLRSVLNTCAIEDPACRGSTVSLSTAPASLPPPPASGLRHPSSLSPPTPPTRLFHLCSSVCICGFKPI